MKQFLNVLIIVLAIGFAFAYLTGNENTVTDSTENIVSSTTNAAETIGGETMEAVADTVEMVAEKSQETGEAIAGTLVSIEKGAAEEEETARAQLDPDTLEK